MKLNPYVVLRRLVGLGSILMCVYLTWALAMYISSQGGIDVSHNPIPYLAFGAWYAVSFVNKIGMVFNQHRFPLTRWAYMASFYFIAFMALLPIILYDTIPAPVAEGVTLTPAGQLLVIAVLVMMAVDATDEWSNRMEVYHL